MADPRHHAHLPRLVGQRLQVRDHTLLMFADSPLQLTRLFTMASVNFGLLLHDYFTDLVTLAVGVLPWRLRGSIALLLMDPHNENRFRLQVQASTCHGTDIAFVLSFPGGSRQARVHGCCRHCRWHRCLHHRRLARTVPGKSVCAQQESHCIDDSCWMRT